MNLVGADDEIVLLAEGGDFFQLVAGEGAAHRVVRIAEQEEPRIVGYDLLQPGHVEFVAELPSGVRFQQRRSEKPPLLIDRRGKKRTVDRRIGHHTVARSADRSADDVEPADESRQHDDGFGLDGPAIEPLHALDQGLFQCLGIHAVAEDTLLYPRRQRVDDRLR